MSRNLKIFFSSDWHLGLVTDGVDRNPEITEFGVRFMKSAASAMKTHDVVVVLGGDIFNSDDPSESDIGCLIRVLNVAKKHNLKVYIMDGNHEATSNKNRPHALMFVKQLEKSYENIFLVDDIIQIKSSCINGDLFLTFLPHISKAKLEYLGVSSSLKPQDYIEREFLNLSKKTVARQCDHIVFSHLTVRGVHGGSEEDLLKRSDVYLPELAMNPQVGFATPLVIQAHHHTFEDKGHIKIVGSPVHCGYGDLADKFYLELDVARQIDAPYGPIYKPACTVKFFECELDLMTYDGDFFKNEKVLTFLKKLKKSGTCYAKFDVTVTADKNGQHSWDLIERKLKKALPDVTFKPINPRIVQRTTVRSEKQKPKIDTKESVKIFLKRNMSSKPEKAKSIFKCSKQFL